MKSFIKSPCDRNRLIERAREVMERRPKVVFAYLFGSLARKTSSPLSDVDIAVYLDDSSDLSNEKLDLIGNLMSELGTDEIDVVVLNRAPLPLMARVLEKNEILIDRKPFRRQAFESLVLREYFDFSIKEKAILERRFSLGG
jgi:predicted nucleotidyltransferase